MNRRHLLKSAANAAVVAAAVTPSVSLVKHSDDDYDQDIVGSWFATFDITNPPIGRTTALFSFHDGGILTSSARYVVTPTPFGTLIETSGHGAWKSVRGHTVEAFQLLFVQRLDTGEVIAIDNVRLSLTLSRDRQTLSGTAVIVGKAPSDALLFELTGTFSATRISV
jgi:hypothetical protein